MIVKVNLLPWREEEKEERAKVTKQYLIISTVIGAALAAAFVFLTLQILDNRNIRQLTIQAELNTLKDAEKMMKERKELTEKLNEQLKVLRDMSAQRFQAVDLMEKISASVPDNVLIISILFKLDEFSFSALAKDWQDLAKHVESLDQTIGATPLPPNKEVTSEDQKFVTYATKIQPYKNDGGKK